jgi:hypothetical protein
MVETKSMTETKSYVLLQSLPTNHIEHRHSPIKVVTYYNDEVIINVWCRDCKQELVQKIYKVEV